MCEQDLHTVVEIERLSHSNPWVSDSFRHELAENPFSRPLVALAEGVGRRPIGYCIYWVVFEEAHVQNVAVHPEHRRRGVARLLLDNALNGAVTHGARHVELEVRRSNVAAQGLYGSLGFDTIGERKGYYSSPREDAVRFKKSLNQER